MIFGDDAVGRKALFIEEPTAGKDAAALFAELGLDYEKDRFGTPPCAKSRMPKQELEFWTFGTLINAILRPFGAKPSRAYLNDG